MVKRRKDDGSDTEEDETLYYRYSSGAPPASGAVKGRGQKSGSGGLAPSRSTLYVSNLDFSLTNSDLHTLFSTFGKVARVTVLKDRHTRQSRGVAFVQFVAQADAQRAAGDMHGKVLNGRTVAASIAIDNGRAPEFIRKRIYKDKSRCYECGEGGHLSYECPRNVLGPRERPLPKKGRRYGGDGGNGGNRGEKGDDYGFDFDQDKWASVVDPEADERMLRVEEEERDKGKRKMKKASYFSDESDEED
ncbi:hypothetical protein SAY87_007838 [Trapa incisa]|uniref:Uncharacterized protein n=1 Tax=Trapa incisa TaxID=236973 RepID=A0AAN7KFP2_9MYRT|nr:hypothetical protein SAY87_007838 [Trapa incisa]